jgi:hypothetical protein
MASGSAHRKFFDFRLIIGAILITTLSAVSMAAPGAASASVTSGSPSVTVLPGGMVRAANGTAAGALRDISAKARPRCTRVEYKGNAGYIAVQERNHRLQWGIVMTPRKYSVGKWNVSTYLSGRKTSSGFNRTVTAPYIPHGSLSVPANKVFHVQAKVVTRYGTFVNVPNACTT